MLLEEPLKLDAKLNIVLHRKQQEIQDSKARFICVKAGKRFGKSRWALYKLISSALELNGGTFWYTAPTSIMARDIGWNQAREMLPREYIQRMPENMLMIELINGSKIHFKGEDNINSLRGPDLNGVVRDECALATEEAWTRILSGQVRGKLNSWAAFISSPNPKGQNWFTNFCKDAERKKLAGDKEWDYFKFTIKDNPYYPESEWMKLKDEHPAYVWDLEYMAEESDLAGVKYNEFSFAKHVKTVTKLGSYRVRGIDWGINHPTTCLWAAFDSTRPLHPETNPIYIYDEYGRTGQVIAESSATIKSKTGNTAIEWTVIDPSTKKRNSQTIRTDADEFSRYGVHCIAGDNRHRGIDITKMFFKRDLIAVDPRCQGLIHELLNLQWGDKEGDDYTDPLRYMLVRIHDITYNGSLFTEVINPDPTTEQRRVCNFNDPIMFPDNKKDELNGWMIEEVA